MVLDQLNLAPRKIIITRFDLKPTPIEKEEIIKEVDVDE